MPTVKPRINVTLEPETYQALYAYSSATRQSMSSIVAGMLNESAESLKKLAAMVNIAKSMDSDARAALVGNLEQAESSMRASMDGLQSLFCPRHSNTGAKLENSHQTDQKVIH